MTNPTVAELFASAAERLRADFEFARQTNPHSGEKGAEVEEILKKFLNEHLPKRFRAGSGLVLDPNDEISKQQDVIVYDAMSSPLYRSAEKTQIVPIDSVAAVIEVKSALSKAELEDAYAKIASVKRLAKRPTTPDERKARPGTSEGTMGIVFAFSSSISLTTIAEHMATLNERHDSALWPEMVVILDHGVVDYAVKFPGPGSFDGNLMILAVPPEYRFGAPPWYVQIVVHSDGRFSLNRFFLNLLSHLHHYPMRSGIPPFKTILAGTSNQVTVMRGYQYDLQQRLRPVPEDEIYDPATQEPPHVQLSIHVSTGNGQKIGEIYFLPWQGGGVLRVIGSPPIPVVVTAMGLGNAAYQVISDPKYPEASYSTILPFTEREFRRLPEKLARVKGNVKLRGTLIETDSRGQRKDSTSEP